MRHSFIHSLGPGCPPQFNAAVMQARPKSRNRSVLVLTLNLFMVHDLLTIKSMHNLRNWNQYLVLSHTRTDRLTHTHTHLPTPSHKSLNCIMIWTYIITHLLHIFSSFPQLVLSSYSPLPQSQMDCLINQTFKNHDKCVSHQRSVSPFSRLSVWGAHCSHFVITIPKMFQVITYHSFLFICSFWGSSTGNC